MRVLLVNTNRVKPAIAPIGLDYIADAIVDAGHEPRLLDLCFSEDVDGDIDAAVRDFDPQVIGVTIRNTDDCYFSGGAFFLPGIKKIVDRLRSGSDAPIVLGGVGFSVAPEAVMDYVGADYGIAGAGEEPVISFLSAYENRSGFDCVPNLLYCENGSVRRSRLREPEANTSIVRRRVFADNPRYFREGGQAGFESKRGCSMNCIYCPEPSAKGRRIRLRRPGLVVDEIRSLLARGIDHFHTCDSEFNIPESHAKDVCRAIIDAGLGEKIRWYAYCAVVPFDDEMADLFKRSGCAGIDFGADSGCDEILQRLGRHYSSDDVVNTARLCRKHGIVFMYDLLLGGPGETRDTVRRTIDLMRRIDADCIGVAMGVRVYDGTAMAEFVRSQGDPASNPALYGAREDNPHFLKPIFYIAPELGEEIVDYVHKIVDGDTRFFLPSNEQVESNYNYNENTVLIDAIRAGARGAYWDILRRMRMNQSGPACSGRSEDSSFTSSARECPPG
ncbi:MAG: B12-binding domain-containing radical SAM protein [Armatimonadota bacterium]